MAVVKLTENAVKLWQELLKKSPPEQQNVLFFETHEMFKRNPDMIAKYKELTNPHKLNRLMDRENTIKLYWSEMITRFETLCLNFEMIARVWLDKDAAFSETESEVILAKTEKHNEIMFNCNVHPNDLLHFEETCACSKDGLAWNYQIRHNEWKSVVITTSKKALITKTLIIVGSTCIQHFFPHLKKFVNSGNMVTCSRCCDIIKSRKVMFPSLCVSCESFMRNEWNEMSQHDKPALKQEALMQCVKTPELYFNFEKLPSQECLSMSDPTLKQDNSSYFQIKGVVTDLINEGKDLIVSNHGLENWINFVERKFYGSKPFLEGKIKVRVPDTQRSAVQKIVFPKYFIFKVSLYSWDLMSEYRKYGFTIMCLHFWVVPLMSLTEQSIQSENIIMMKRKREDEHKEIQKRQKFEEAKKRYINREGCGFF